MSRATVDLQSIRFFLGYGLIFITQNPLTIVLAGAVMFVLNPVLALLALVPVPFVVCTASRYNRRSRPAVQEVQQRIAELTAEAEENISGIRIVKAFAREEHHARPLPPRGRPRLRPEHLLDPPAGVLLAADRASCRSSGSPLVLLVGGRQVIDGNLSLGNFTAFYTYLVMLVGPMRMLGMSLGMAQRASPPATGCSRSSTASRRSRARPGAPPLPAGGGQVALRGVTLRYDGAEPGADRTSTSRSRPGRTVALVGPTGVGQDQPGRR